MSSSFASYARPPGETGTELLTLKLSGNLLYPPVLHRYELCLRLSYNRLATHSAILKLKSPVQQTIDIYSPHQPSTLINSSRRFIDCSVEVRFRQSALSFIPIISSRSDILHFTTSRSDRWHVRRTTSQTVPYAGCSLQLSITRHTQGRCWKCGRYELGGCIR